MKKLFLFSVILCFLITTNSLLAQSWQWATIEAGANAEGYALAKDNAGNVFLAGNHTGPASFGTSSFTVPSSGNFVLKYSPAGVLLWAFEFTSVSAAIVDIDTDNAGNVYLSCGLLGTGTIGTYTLVSNGNTDMLVMKISNSGTLLWAKSFGGPGTEHTSSIATDGSGNFVVCGTYNSTAINFSTLTLTNPNISTGFVVKFDANGNALWAKNILSPSNPQVTSVAVDANSNAYVTGNFSNQISAGTTTLSSAGTSDVFVARYSSAGNLIWMIRTGATGQEYGNGIKPDPFGNVYFTGRMAGSVCAIGSTTYATIGNSYDAYIAKLDSTGTFLWNYRIGSNGSEVGYSIAANTNAVFLASSAQTTVIVVGTQTFTFSGNIDGMLITQFNSSGGLVNTIAVDGGGDDQMDLCLDNCALYLGGDLSTPSVNFGNIVLTHTASESPFVARLQLAVGEPTISISGAFSICVGASATLQANGANSYVWSNGAASNSIVVSPSTNSVYVVTGSSPTLACASTTAQTIVVMPLPTLNIVSNPSIICTGASATLSASGANTYTWNNGATGTSQIITALATSSYSAIGTNTLTTCSASTSIQLTTKKCTDIEPLNIKPIGFSVYPNPSTNDINIYSTDECDLMLTNVLGEKIITLHINANETKLVDFSHYDSGIYYLNCLQTNEVRKIIIEDNR